jgi:uncharacterized protein YcbK (DUF882 family)
MSAHSSSPPNRSRRRFLAGVGGLIAGVVSAGARAWAPASLELKRRTVAFVHTHTGERLTADYYLDGQYQAQCLAQVNYLLRDFRTGDVHRIDPALLDLLFSLQARSGCDGPYAVISGYRSPATNAMLRRTTEGVASHSMHLQGRAIDIRLPGYPTARLGELARGLGRGGVGFYPRSDFVHVDTGRVRFW